MMQMMHSNGSRFGRRALRSVRQRMVAVASET